MSGQPPNRCRSTALFAEGSPEEIDLRNPSFSFRPTLLVKDRGKGGGIIDLPKAVGVKAVAAKEMAACRAYVGLYLCAAPGGVHGVG